MEHTSANFRYRQHRFPHKWVTLCSPYNHRKAGQQSLGRFIFLKSRQKHLLIQTAPNSTSCSPVMPKGLQALHRKVHGEDSLKIKVRVGSPGPSQVPSKLPFLAVKFFRVILTKVMTNLVWAKSFLPCKYVTGEKTQAVECQHGMPEESKGWKMIN